MTSKAAPIAPFFLGLEAGGTRTTVLLADGNGTEVWSAEGGPANLRLLNDAQLVRHLRSLKPPGFRPDALAIGMAGARTPADWERIRRAAARVWPNIPCVATNDLETALLADDEAGAKPLPRVLVLSGTGSCCFGRTPEGKTFKFGGWGHILGDKGSGYEIGMRALKACVYYYDRDGEWSLLGRRILQTLQLNEPNDLIGWAQSAGKTEIAALAVEVFAAAAQRDEIARDILEGAAHSLAKDAAGCAARLVKKGAGVQFIFAGSVLLKQPKFAARVREKLLNIWPRASVNSLARSGVWGAIALARQAHATPASNRATVRPTRATARPPFGSGRTLRRAPYPFETAQSLALSPTEQRNPKSVNLDKLPLRDAVTLMLAEDAQIPQILQAERDKIEWAVARITRAFQRGGRLFYVGAGTSGRLGILDASECPPTFRTPPDMVQGIIAGGQRAIWSAVEGAEDEADAGARAVAFRDVNGKDVLVGIAASGRTPFVWGALAEARRRRATTILLCFNPSLEIAREHRPDLVIAPNLGPEILTGSTRLKAGTATKLILNIFTTLAMVRIGKVIGNLMVDLNPNNSKLRDRAVRILQQLTGADAGRARDALERNGWVVKKAHHQLLRQRS
ncbi:MAG: N-acetylmuramic acid 6-phosphate etherase [Verrucomicrobiota bacterium]